MGAERPLQPTQDDIAEGPHEKTRIKDKAAAEEVGYAEKPFRDTLTGIGKAFSAEIQQALNTIANYRGEGALADYMKKNSVDKNRAKEILQKQLLAKIGESVFPEKAGYESPKSTRDFFISAVGNILQSEIDRAINLPPTEIQEALFSILTGVVAGAREMTRANSRGQALLHVFRENLGKGPIKSPDNRETTMLIGALLHDLVTGRQERAMEILEFLQKELPAQKEEMMAKLLPVIERWRADWDNIDIGIRNEALVDARMGSLGYVYDPEQKKYLTL